jgi:hypothetical protein
VPLRYGRMLVSPFAFYRGAAAVMAADLGGAPRSGFGVQLCGDAHLANFGAYASPDRRLVFDVNDFDETLPGPWEWDAMRLAASLAVAGRANGFGRPARRGRRRDVGRVPGGDARPGRARQPRGLVRAHRRRDRRRALGRGGRQAAWIVLLLGRGDAYGLNTISARIPTTRAAEA